MPARCTAVTHRQPEPEEPRAVAGKGTSVVRFTHQAPCATYRGESSRVASTALKTQLRGSNAMSHVVRDPVGCAHPTFPTAPPEGTVTTTPMSP